MSSHKGMVLFTSVMLLSILTLLLLSLLQFSALTMKARSRLAVRNMDLYQLESMLSRLMREDVFTPHSKCNVKNRTTSEVAQMLRNKTGCQRSEGKITYRYWMEDLGGFPCLQVQTDSRGILGSHHWIISIALETSLTPIIQVRIAVPDATNECLEESTIIPSGVLSWVAIN